MRDEISAILSKYASLSKEEIAAVIEIPKDSSLGDYAFPCFILSKQLKKNPVEIAKELSSKIKSKDFEKIEAKGPYLNFFVNRSDLAEETINKILKEKDKFGSSKEGKNKKVVIDLSAPNIAKPFGIGHLRSTIIGNSISNLAEFQGYKVTKINYLGDWGTQFGKLITAYKKWGDKNKLNSDPIKHLQELYVRINNLPDLEDEARAEFKKLEDGNKQNMILWKKFRELSVKEFNKIYSLLGIKFDIISGESFYNNKMQSTVKMLENKGLLEESEGAQIVNLEKYGLGVCLIKKKDGATLYATRDITAAIDRFNKLKFDKMIYEVGAEQKFYFKQFFKVLELAGFSWARNCVHVSHGLYLDSDGKKFSTRKGKIVFMVDILNETIDLAKKEISKREKLSSKELESRAKLIALAAILYGDLKNYREGDMLFDIERFISFEGDTGPYLLYSYARAKSILKKAKYSPKKLKVKDINEGEKALIIKLNQFPDTARKSFEQYSPNLIANYAFQLSQTFNEFYHSTPVIGSENQQFRLSLVDSFSIVLKNALNLLGIKTTERM